MVHDRASVYGTARLGEHRTALQSGEGAGAPGVTPTGEDAGTPAGETSASLPQREIDTGYLDRPGQNHWPALCRGVARRAAGLSTGNGAEVAS